MKQRRRMYYTAAHPVVELAGFVGAHAKSGGIASFLGQVRDDDAVESLELPDHARMSLRGVKSLGKAARVRWSLDSVLILHWCGLMTPGNAIVLVAATARHRRDAFAATEFLIDHLKSDGWF